jgi:hypothetical protein
MERIVFTAQYLSSGRNAVCRKIRPFAGLFADVRVSGKRTADCFVVEIAETDKIIAATMLMKRKLLCRTHINPFCNSSGYKEM